jgi:hypothetical protein
MGEIGWRDALHLPVHWRGLRLLSAQRSDHETNHVATNVHLSSAVNRERRRFLQASSWPIPLFRAEFLGFTSKSVLV